MQHPDQPHHSSDRSLGFEILARGLYTRSGRVLVCRSRIGRHCYLPGGHVEFGERPAAALAREIAEETGLLATIGPPILVAEACFSDGERPHHEFSLVFHVEHLRTTDGDEIGDQDPPASLEDDIGFEWVRVADLGAQEFRPAVILDRLSPTGPQPIGPPTELARGVDLALRGAEH